MTRNTSTLSCLWRFEVVIVLSFQIVNLGELRVQGQAIVQGTPPPAQNPGGSNVVQVNYNYNWLDFSNMVAVDITTGQRGPYDYLGAVNNELGTSMTTSDLGNLILLHEFKHTPLGGNAQQESDFVKFNKNIYDNCIK